MNREPDDRVGATGPHILIAGGGVAALEAALALRRLTTAQLPITLLSPAKRFDYRPLSVLAPFGDAPSLEIDLAAFAAEHDLALCHGELHGVDPEAHRAITSTGELAYDALLVATGAQPSEALRGAQWFGGRAQVTAMEGIIESAELGQARRLAFVACDPVAWQLPLFELALLTRRHLRTRGLRDVEVTLVTPELDPLEALGEDAADTLGMLLASEGVVLRSDARAVAVRDREIVLDDGGRIAADHVVTLPRYTAQEIAGLPQDDQGFVPIDEFGRVSGMQDVYAAGDVTAGMPKQGGMAARQAVAAAQMMLSRAGLLDDPRPFEAVVTGTLLTPETLDRVGAEDWRPPTKIVAEYLAAYLHTREPDSRHPEAWTRTGGLPAEIEV